MHLKVSRQEFLKNMKIVENAISENKVRPVISGIYIQAYNGEIQIRGTNLEQTIFTNLKGEIIEEGKVVFKYKIVEEYIKELIEDNVDIFVNEGVLMIQTESSKSEFGLLDVEEYPELIDIYENEEFWIDKNLLLDKMQKTIIAAGSVSENSEINCIRLDIEYQKMAMVGTDKFRLMLMEEELHDIDTNYNLKVSIPYEPCTSLLKILQVTESEKILIKRQSGQIYFKLDNISLMSRTIQLEYINYKEIINANQFDKKIIINRKEFISLLKRVIIFVRDNLESKYGAIFEFKGDKLFIRGIAQNAKVNDQVEIYKEGGDVTVSLNTKYLLDFLQTVDSEEIEMNILGPESGIILREKDNLNMTYLTMPLALREE